MAERAPGNALFWQVWAAAAALATAVSGVRLLLPQAPAAQPTKPRAVAQPRVEPTTVVEQNAAPPPIDPVLARLAAASTSGERCQLLAQLEASEDTRITYAITSVLESSQLVTVRACATQALTLQSNPAARSWLVDLADDPEPEVHSLALTALAGSTETADRAVVIEATHSENSDIRVSAVSVLLQLGLPEGFAAFQAVLPSVEDRNTLATLIEALHASHDVRALPALEALIDNADNESHLQAIGTLGDFDFPGVRKRLEGLLEVGSDSEFRAASSELDKLAPTATLAKLRALLASGNEERQTFALNVILSLETPDQLSILSDQLHSSNKESVRAVLAHLMMKPEPTLEGPLTELAKSSSNTDLGGLALSALWRIPSPSAHAAAKELAKLPRKGRFKGNAFEEEPTGTDEEIRAARIAKLDRGDENSTGALYALVSDASDAAQAAALRYVERPGGSAMELGNLAASGQASTLRKLVEHRSRLDDEHRRALIQAVAQRGDPQFSGVLKDALRDPDQATRNSALRSLLEMGDASVAADLDKLTRASDPGDRTLAAELLGARNDPGAERELEALASDANPEVVASALHALQAHSPEQISGLAQRAFRAASPDDRVTLLNSLSDLKSSVARPLYDLALSGSDDATTLQAVQSLATLAGPESAQRLLAVVNDSNRSQEVRTEAASGLRHLGGPLARANRALLDSLSPVEPSTESDQCNGM